MTSAAAAPMLDAGPLSHRRIAMRHREHLHECLQRSEELLARGPRRWKTRQIIEELDLHVTAKALGKLLANSDYVLRVNNPDTHYRGIWMHINWRDYQ